MTQYIFILTGTYPMLIIIFLNISVETVIQFEIRLVKILTITIVGINPS